MSFHSDVYTVESVTSGHPDKVCDQISDAILDAYLERDAQSRVAVESFGSHGLLVLGGEVTSIAEVDTEAIARKVYRDIGYTDELDVIAHISKQSPDIARGVDTGGAGDQGMMYGYATSETPEYLPRAVVIAHALARGLERLRREDPSCAWMRPDGKTQVTMSGEKITALLVSTQHDESVDKQMIVDALREKLFAPLIGDLDGMELLVNPTGKFVQGGFSADAGLTGRKIMVDTYGGLVPHGGGAFSGKDATKVDRSAAYMCRFVSKNLVANGYASTCLVSVAYAIGRAEPVMLRAVDEHGRAIDGALLKKFDFRPRAIAERLGLQRAVFQKTASYGHFGRPDFSWEEIISL
jgi:S-adenosylmethionine synthetase